GSCPGQRYFHVYRGGVRFGKKVDGQPAVGKHTQRHEKRNQHHREDGILYAGFGELHRFIASTTDARELHTRITSLPAWSLQPVLARRSPRANRRKWPRQPRHPASTPRPLQTAPPAHLPSPRPGDSHAPR